MATMGGGRFCFKGDMRGGSTGGGADRDEAEDVEELEASGEKTGTGGTFLGDVSGSAGSDVLDVRLAGEVAELVDGEKGEEGMGVTGTDRTGRARSAAGTGGGAANEPLLPRVAMGGGGGGTLDMRPCFLRYDVYIVPLFIRSIGGLDFASSTTGSDIDLASIGWMAAEAADEASRSAGMGGGMTLGRRWSTSCLVADVG